MKILLLITPLILTTTLLFSQSITTDTTLASQYIDTADIHHDSADYQLAIDYYNKALPLYQQHQLWEQTLDCENDISYNYHRLGDNEKALEAAKHTIKQSQNILGTGTKQEANTCNNIGLVYDIQGRFDEALSYYQKALDILQKLFGEQHNAVAHTYHNLGGVYYQLGHYDKAEDFYKKALEIQKASYGEQHSSVANGYENIGILHAVQGDFATALSYFDKSLAIGQALFGDKHPDVISTYHNIGTLYRYLGRYQMALDYLEKALRLRLEVLGAEHPSMGNSYLNIGVIYGLQGRHQKAIIYHQKAIDLAQKLFEEPHPSITDSYNNLAITYGQQGYYEQALEYHQKVLTARLDLFGEQHDDVATSYYNLAFAYRNQRRYDEALHYSQKALSVRQAIFGEQHPDVAFAYYALGMLYYDQEDYPQALNYLQNALTIRQNLFGEQHPRVAEAYNSIGSIYAHQHRNENALNHFLKALTIQHNLLGSQHPSLVLSYNNLSGVYKHQEQYNNALQQTQQALLANGISIDTSLADANPTTTQFADALNAPYLLQTLHIKASIFQQRQQEGDLEKAYQIAQLADQLIDTLRNGYKSSDDQLIFNQLAHEVYACNVEGFYKLYQNTQHTDYLNQAFHHAEKGKAQALHYALNESHALRFAGLPDSLLEQESDLKAQINYYTQQLRSGDSAVAYQQLLFEQKANYRALLAQLEADYPDYYRLKFANATPSLANAQAQLPDAQTALIEYILSDSSLFAFTLTKATVQFHQLSIDSLLEQDINTLLDGLYGSRSSSNYSTPAYSLYQRLFEPLSADLPNTINRLIIVPDGMLNYIPFEVLLSERPSAETSYHQYPYLLLDYAVSYNYSTTLFQEMQNKPSRATKSLLAIAPSFSGAEQIATRQVWDSLSLGRRLEDYQFPALAYNAAEVQQIQQLLGGRLLLGHEATKANFLDLANQYAILHLATHAKATTNNPNYSMIAFSESSDSSYNDYLLTAGELYNYTLPAELIVLSACQTGTGQLQRGEGLMSLARAFTYAGAKSLVTSLWNVSDESTSKLMAHFYKHLSKGLSKDEALRQARLDYLNDIWTDEARTHPFYWASFIAIGDMQPIPQRGWPWWWGLVGLVIIGLGWMIWRRR